MLLIFVDESYQGGWFGVSMVSINATHYYKLKTEHVKLLDKYEWNHKEDIEFKASQVFSPTKGDTTVDIETRKKMVEELSANTTSAKNSKMDILFSRKEIAMGERWEFYYEIVPKMLSKALSGKKDKNTYKNVCFVFLDDFQKNNKKADNLRSNVANVIKKRNFSFFEDIFYIKSSIYTIGIIYADLIAYFKLKSCLNGEKDEIKIKIKETFLDNVPAIKEIS